ncbi:hypothetical protein, conserved [Babesia ovata]|uniref:Uncharacterized protein n=1 Tax=Babesia ovata TaxID=189622 RepID=A0A2H6KD57_9APIC|nr:uncharacterized protein BOVATA_023910 [Babesia ovata]XP_028867168.1 uncharacterized protein BOVATA_024180 [Babesia ovata]GBE60898.1 hypothetical protein, conserved [Babesia ovata]GBE60925.1 hypothetical protein, conserved [Babesia ovata]
MVYNSLTEAPRNLKECFDWLVALKGADAKKNLAAMGAAVYGFLVDKPVGTLLIPSLEKVKRLSKEFLEQKELRDRPYVKEVLNRFKEPMNKDFRRFRDVYGDSKSDYKNVVKARGVKPEDIARNVTRTVSSCEKFLDDIKIPDQYKSAYSSEATWEASCSKNPEACAVVLVGIAPMLYVGVGCLWVESYDDYIFRGTSNRDRRLGKIMKALGFVEPGCRAGISGSDVLQTLRNTDEDLVDILYDFAGFWAFY